MEGNEPPEEVCRRLRCGTWSRKPKNEEWLGCLQGTLRMNCGAKPSAKQKQRGRDTNHCSRPSREAARNTQPHERKERGNEQRSRAVAVANTQTKRRKDTRTEHLLFVSKSTLRRPRNKSATTLKSFLCS